MLWLKCPLEFNELAKPNDRVGKSNVRTQNIYCSSSYNCLHAVLRLSVLATWILYRFIFANGKSWITVIPVRCLFFACSFHSSEIRNFATKSIRNEIDLVPIDHWLWAFTRFFSVQRMCVSEFVYWNHHVIPGILPSIRFYVRWFDGRNSVKGSA